MKTTDTAAYLEVQHRFRGLIANYRSRRFTEERTYSRVQQFRSGLQSLFLDARATVEPDLYRSLLEWIYEQSKSQLPNLDKTPIGFDELAGIYGKAPIITLESELRWVAERLRLESNLLHRFLLYKDLVQTSVARDNFVDSIKHLQDCESECGASLWAVQLRIACEQSAGGLERQKRYSAQVRTVHQTGLLNFVAYYSSVLNEERTTYNKFLDDIEARINSISAHTDDIKSYNRYRIKNEFDGTDKGLANILRVEQSHGLIDIYETFVAVLQEIAARGNNPAIARCAIECIESIGIDDFRLSKIAHALGGAIDPSIPYRDRSISDLLFHGDVGLAVLRSRRVLSTDPWQYIYAGCAFGHRQDVEISSQTRLSNFAKMLGTYLSGSIKANDAFAQLIKFSMNFRGLPVAAGLLQALRQLLRDWPDQSWQPWLIGLNSATIGAEDLPWPRSVEAAVPAEGDATTLAWNESIQPTESTALSHRLLRALGYAHAAEFSEVDGALGHENLSWPAPLRGFRALVQLHASFRLGERQKVVQLIADAGSRTRGQWQSLPVINALKDLSWADYKSVGHPLASPIALHLLWSQRETSENASKMRYATGYSLRKIGVRRPSDIEAASIDVKLHELVYFLRYVCVPEVLDLSRLFSGSLEILEERQAICGLLARIDAQNSEVYHSEIVAIANTLELDEGQWIVDSTRIHVDSDALIRWATRELSEDYDRYKDLVGIDVGSPQSFEGVLKELNSNTLPRTKFNPENEADAVLLSILRRLGEEFLTNASFGLDFYLSKRVRHQSFVGLIRGPLEFADLITTRETEDESRYHRNDTWLSRFSSTDDLAKNNIDDALNKFSTEFDEIIALAKDEYFQLKSIDNPKGLIVLTLNERMISLSRALIKLDFVSGDFFRIAVPILWAAIDASLLSVRSFIDNDLKPRLIREFDLVRARVRELAEQDGAWYEFDAAMGGASNEVQLKLDEVARWFVHADTSTQQRLFSLDQILRIGVDTALKSQRGFSPKVSQSSVGDLHLASANLVFVHDVIFVGIGNARKHSGLKEPSIDFSALWNEADETLTLGVISDCRATVRAEKEKQADVIRSIIETGAHSRRTRIEEGSGFAKLAAVVVQSDRGRLEFGFTPDGRFSLKVTFAIIRGPSGAHES